MRFLLILALLSALLRADDRKTIEAMYASTFASLTTIQTQEDLLKMVNAFGAPEWTSSQPNGQTLSRAEAVKMLEEILPVPAAQRPSPQMQVAYYHETAWNATILYWIYRTEGSKLIGSLAPDMFARTANGWRRIRHEKYFPDRPLAEGATILIAPIVD